MSGHSELAFETAIEAYLTRAGGYQKRDASAYDEALTLFPVDVTGFLQDKPGQGAGDQGQPACSALWL